MEIQISKLISLIVAGDISIIIINFITESISSTHKINVNLPCKKYHWILEGIFLSI